MIQQPSRDEPIVKASLITQDQFQGWIDEVTRLLNKLEPIQGNGSPEGVIFADKWRVYENNTGGAGTLKYVKNTAISLNTGWINFA